MGTVIAIVIFLVFVSIVSYSIDHSTGKHHRNMHEQKRYKNTNKTENEAMKDKIDDEYEDFFEDYDDFFEDYDDVFDDKDK